jgi:hypothetical protein
MRTTDETQDAKNEARSSLADNRLDGKIKRTPPSHMEIKSDEQQQSSRRIITTGSSSSSSKCHTTTATTK